MSQYKNSPYGGRSVKQEKTAIYLKSKGWYTYYNQNCWMHPRIEEKATCDLGNLALWTEDAIKQQERWDSLPTKEQK